MLPLSSNTVSSIKDNDELSIFSYHNDEEMNVFGNITLNDHVLETIENIGDNFSLPLNDSIDTNDTFLF